MRYVVTRVFGFIMLRVAELLGMSLLNNSTREENRSGVSVSAHLVSRKSPNPSIRHVHLLRQLLYEENFMVVKRQLVTRTG